MRSKIISVIPIMSASENTRADNHQSDDVSENPSCVSPGNGRCWKNENTEKHEKNIPILPSAISMRKICLPQETNSCIDHMNRKLDTSNATNERTKRIIEIFTIYDYYYKKYSSVNIIFTISLSKINKNMRCMSLMFLFCHSRAGGNLLFLVSLYCSPSLRGFIGGVVCYSSPSISRCFEK